MAAKHDKELEELKHGAVKGYKPVFGAVLAAAVIYLAYIFLSH
ncbi:hypothetical protein [Geovibrio thiophilus]|nr:hypothetical protein [Geovibrio thiophilus]